MLLDRDLASQKEGPGTASGAIEDGASESRGKSKISSLLSTFNVATFSRTVESEDKESMRGSDDSSFKKTTDSDEISWKDLLGARAKEEKALELMKMGKGKRERRRANIVNIGGGGEISGGCDGADDDGDSGGDSDFSDGGKSRRQRRKIENELGVVGLTEREKSAYNSRLLKFGLRGGAWEQMHLLYANALNRRSVDEVTAYSISLFGNILTSHVEYLKRKARSVTQAPHGGTVSSEESPYAKELQRVGIIELICRKMIQTGSNPAHFSINEGGLTSWRHEHQGTGTWSAVLDHRLLDGVLKHGYGNWKALFGDEVG